MKKSILVVDDDKSNLVMAQQLLAEEYRVSIVNSAALGLRYLEKNIPDLILLDIQMPEMNGFEVMEILQASETWKKIPVIFLTADRGTDTEENCFRMGARDYIAKPFVPMVMLARIRRTLELEDYQKMLEQMVQEQLARITQLQQDTIMMMANLIESRDGTTGGHIKRTSLFVKMLVDKMREEGIYAQELNDAYVEHMRRAAPLHDIGKIKIPDMILQKPGALTEEEYELMKSHAKEGSKIIRENISTMVESEFVQVAVDMAGSHHERWNGSGYPKGLQGSEIPLAARILAVTDVFDAMVFKRQYKEAMPLEEVMEIMAAERGKIFEPAILDVFLDMKEDLQKAVCKMKEM